MIILLLLLPLLSIASSHSLPLGKTGPIVEREGYALQYNSQCKTSHWVSYTMKDTDLVSNVSRTNDFRTDSSLSVPQAKLADYKNSGYDRGHMARAGLFTKSKKLMSESFFLSNMIPQDSYMNQSGAWRRLEDFEFNAIKNKKMVQIVSGPVVGPNDQRIGSGEVCVPEVVYKVLYQGGAKPSAIGFLIPNYRTDKKFTEYAVSVDEVEAVTGIDFFPELPNSTEASVESKFDLNNW